MWLSNLECIFNGLFLGVPRWVCISTVGINPRLSDLKGPGTSKLDWRYLEHNKIDRNELQIRTNSQKGTGTKIAEKLNNFEKFERKKVKFPHCS